MTDRANVQQVRPSRTKVRGEHLVWAAVYAGGVLALVGVVDGIDVGGYNSGLGTAIVVISSMVAILIGLVGFVALSVLKG